MHHTLAKTQHIKQVTAKKPSLLIPPARQIFLHVIHWPRCRSSLKLFISLETQNQYQMLLTVFAWLEVLYVALTVWVVIASGVGSQVCAILTELVGY